jgi:hypothetical protein
MTTTTLIEKRNEASPDPTTIEIQEKVFRSVSLAKLHGRRGSSIARKMKETEKSRRHFPEKTPLYK